MEESELNGFSDSCWMGNQENEIQFQDVPNQSWNTKPPYSYAGLIRLAIYNSAEGKMTLAEIYHYIIQTFPYYKNAGPGWKNSIRHNLSLNKCFRKVARGKDDPGKGSYWSIDRTYTQDDNFIRKRKSTHDIPYDTECNKVQYDLKKENSTDILESDVELCNRLGLTNKQEFFTVLMSLLSQYGITPENLYDDTFDVSNRSTDSCIQESSNCEHWYQEFGTSEESCYNYNTSDYSQFL